ncbi:uncharacterized protein BJ212DRAFT_1392985, partial [Suillus subaureus]
PFGRRSCLSVHVIIASRSCVISHWTAFWSIFLAEQCIGEYKKIASHRNIIAHVKDVASVHNMRDITTVEILELYGFFESPGFFISVRAPAPTGTAA